MSNNEIILKQQNGKLINNRNETSNESCNCRNQATCPLKGGNCRTASVNCEAPICTLNDTRNTLD